MYKSSYICNFKQICRSYTDIKCDFNCIYRWYINFGLPTLLHNAVKKSEKRLFYVRVCAPILGHATVFCGFN